MTKGAELEKEQEYFDEAWEARENSRATWTSAHQAAAGPRSAASAVNKSAKEKLAKMGASDEEVAFAMFESEKLGLLYIGKHVISSQDSDILVMNWQAPAATAYFEATFDDPCGVIRRRKFQTEKNRVLDFEEVIFAELAASVESLTESERTGIDDSILRDLDKDRTGEMQDIVQTIHAAQYKLVRSPLDQLLLVQGGPGTGKSAVALHRVSWLLFNNLGSLRAEDVLVIGPNPTFTRYIRSVLPGLGDEEVRHRDLRGLGPQSSTGRTEGVDTARLKGEARMATLIAEGLQQRVRFPQDLEHIPVGRFRLSRDGAEEQLRRVRRTGAPYGTARTNFRSWLAQEVGDRASATQVDAAVERVWPSLTPQTFLRDLFGSRERLVGAAGDQFTAGDVQRLMRSAATKVTQEEWSDADVALLDEADALISGSVERFGHVVVDEAQDLSPMQLRSVRRRSVRGSMTVVGDLAQSTGPWARDSWADVIEALQQEHPARVEELKLGYRVPEQIFSLAARLLPAAAPGIEAPRVVRKGPAEPDIQFVDSDEQVTRAVDAARDYAGRGLFVGIVCPDLLRDDLVSALQRSSVAWSDASAGNLSKSINVVRPEEAKGLEFDAVVVVEPEMIVEESHRGLRLLYVALTRATRYLTVVHAGALLPVAGLDADVEPRPPAMEESVSEPPPAVVDVTEDVAPESQTVGGAAPTHAQDETVANGAPPDPLVTEVVTDAAEALPAPVVHRQAPAAPPGDDLSRSIAAIAATSIAGNIRASVAPNLWPLVIDQLRRELGVSEDAVFELFGLGD